MRNILALAQREMRSYFYSPIAYVVITGLILLTQFFFVNLLLVYNKIVIQIKQNPYAGDIPNLNEFIIGRLLATLLVVLVFAIPMLTMRSFAEEKKQGTFELLMTSTLTIKQIVLGKFLGLASIVLVATIAVGTYPLILYFMGEPSPEVGPIFSGVLAFFLCGIAFTSLGLAISCWTENQVVAAIMSMVVLLLLYVVHSVGEATGGNVAMILNRISPVLQSQDLLKGVITGQSLVYFASVVWMGLFLAERALESNKA